MENYKTSRESSTREKSTRKKDWTPPSSLDAPAAPQGYAHRWIRTSTAGFEDPGNVSKKLREGWEFVKAETILSEIGQKRLPSYPRRKTCWFNRNWWPCVGKDTGRDFEKSC